MRIIVLILLIASINAYKFDDCEQEPEDLNRIRRIGEKSYAYNLDFFYQKALPYSATHAFTDVLLQINLTNPDRYQFYQSSNCTSVQHLYDTDNRYFGLLRSAALLRSHHLDPFQDTIIGVSTTDPYEISVLILNVNYIRVGIYVAAIVLFLLAEKLVRNVVFYYTSGCSFGLLASILLVAFIVWRVAPKKAIGVPILIGGWSVSLYMIHFAWTNFQSIMIEYQKYVIGYFTAVILISMAYCYKKGPPTDARSHNIAQWTLQLLALALIYFSVQIIDVSFGTIVVLIILQIFHGTLFSCFGKVKYFRQKMFPVERRYLTEEEYDEIGRKTTSEELEKLREYCKNGANNPWEIARNVDSARRLARFVEGEGHVTDEEVRTHDLSGDVLDRDEYSDSFNRRLYEMDSLLRPGLEEDEQDESDEQEYDEIFLRRHDTYSGRSTVQSVRIPRSVSARLFTPPQNRLNRSMGPAIGRRAPEPINLNGYHSDRRLREPRTEQINRNRVGLARFNQQPIAPPEPPRVRAQPRGGMTPSQYMRSMRNEAAGTPMRRSSRQINHS